MGLEHGMEVDPTPENEAAEKRRKTAAGEDRSVDANETIEAEKQIKYEKACAERDEVLEAIRKTDQRNAAADPFFKVNANIYFIYIEEAKKIGTNLAVEVFESVLDEEGRREEHGDVYGGRDDRRHPPGSQVVDGQIRYGRKTHTRTGRDGDRGLGRFTQERNKKEPNPRNNHERTHPPPHTCNHTHANTHTPQHTH